MKKQISESYEEYLILWYASIIKKQNHEEKKSGSIDRK